jgi:hypothetical protein
VYCDEGLNLPQLNTDFDAISWIVIVNLNKAMGETVNFENVNVLEQSSLSSYPGHLSFKVIFSYFLLEVGRIT